MAQNNINLITKYSAEAWDLVYKQESVTSLLKPAIPVRWVGAKTVKVPKLQLGGLSNYYRNNNAYGLGDPRVPNAGVDGVNPDAFVGAADFGYQKAPTQVTWEEYTVRMDRAAAYQIETFDNEEVGGELVGTVVTEVNRTQIVPEVDAYVLSKIASYALAEGTVQENITTAPLAALNAGIQYLDEHAVPVGNQIGYVSAAFMAALRNTNEVTKVLLQDDYRDEFDVKFKITKYEGRPLVMVTPDKFRTDFVSYEGGYTWGQNSVPINFILLDKTAVVPVQKYTNVKVVGGEINLAGRGFDGYTVFARIYHDVFVFDNKRPGIYVSLPATGTAPVNTFDLRIVDGVVTNITTPNSKWGYAMTYDGAYVGTISVGDAVKLSGTPGADLILSEFTEVHPGDAVTTTTNFYFIGNGANGLEVIAIFTHTVA